MRIAIIGSTGQLGTDLVEILKQTGKYAVFPLTHAEIECADIGSVSRALTTVWPDVVINCAAYVRVDECEDRTEEAFRVNAVGALNIAKVGSELKALCIYISTDYVFDGNKEGSYTEEDVPCPINVYGASKLAGEFLVSQSCSRSLIVRLASLFGKAGARGKGGNFVETILAKARSVEPIRVVNDIRMSPTYSYDAAQGLEELIREGATGIFHVTNNGSCTWYDFARETLELAGMSAKLEPVSSSECPTKASRPKNSSLRSTKMSEQRSWEQALRAYLLEKGYIRS